MSEASASSVTLEELALATRNHGMPLEALREDVTPVGLHYLLTHYDIPAIDVDEWRLRLDGGTGATVDLSLAELRALPAVDRIVTMECAGNGRALVAPRPLSQPWLLEAVGTGHWTGVALADVLERIDIAKDTVELVFRGADRGIEHGVEQHYERSLPLSVAKDPLILLAYELNGMPLPPQHGSPLRLIVPGWYGMTNVKWLSSITAVNEPFTGFQQSVSYRLREHADDPGTPLMQMQPRSLMIPPGIPEFPIRTRHVPVGEHVVTGRAWSGFAPIVDVAFSADGGETWTAAEVDPSSGPGRWQRWRSTWTAHAGSHELCCRATDAAGNTQPLVPAWNAGGYSNNAVQRVPVQVD